MLESFLIVLVRSYWGTSIILHLAISPILLRVLVFVTHLDVPWFWVPASGSGALALGGIS